jgi:thioredoxin reductase (NADPH)
VAQAVCIAAGVGAFVPKKLPIPDLDAWLGTQVSYGLPAHLSLAGQRVVVVGGEEQAVDAVLALARRSADEAPASITLLHRRDQFVASPQALTELHDLHITSRISVQVGQVQAIGSQGLQNQPASALRLTQLTVEDPLGQTVTLVMDHLLVCLGMSPRLGPLADWGLALQHKQLLVNPATLATSQTGIYAVGDVVIYPGKRRLIVCAFHEATLAAFAIRQQLQPETPEVLLYTSSSALLHKRLGLQG